MSNCGVCIGSNYDEYEGNDFDCGPHVFTENLSCCECGEVIPAGEQFESAHWNDEDTGPEEAHTCSICAEIAWAFSCRARVYFNLWADMQDYVFEEFSNSCLDKLKTPAAKSELQRRWMKWKGLVA